jgi:hypothetical protein
MRSVRRSLRVEKLPLVGPITTAIALEEMSGLGIPRKLLEHSRTTDAAVHVTSWQTTVRESEPRCGGRCGKPNHLATVRSFYQ